MTLQRATRVQLGDQPGTWMWIGNIDLAAGTHTYHLVIQYITHDPTIEAYLKTLVTDDTVSLALVDQNGTELAKEVQFRLDAPPRPGPPDPDSDALLEQIRALSNDPASPLAALAQELDRHLSAGGALPGAWSHPEWSDE